MGVSTLRQLLNPRLSYRMLSDVSLVHLTPYFDSSRSCSFAVHFAIAQATSTETVRWLPTLYR